MVGRDIETKSVIDEILNRKADCNKVIISSFDGMPAVGKTTFAVHIAHLLTYEYPDAQLFIDCYGYTVGHSPLNKEQILDSLMFAMGITSTRIPKKYEDKLSLWIRELYNKSVLIIFDNVCDEEQIKDLLMFSTSSLFIITSRKKLLFNDSYPVTIDTLDTEDSVLVLNGGSVEKDKIRYNLLKQLANEYGNLPLALQILSHKIKDRNLGYIQRLVNNRKLENLSNVSDSVYASFDVSYKGLSDSEQRLIQVLGIFPGYDFTPCSCAAMIGKNTDFVYNDLDALYEYNLIKEIEDDRYVLHDLMREFAREKYIACGQNIEITYKRLIQFYIECVICCNKLIYPYNYREEFESEYKWHIDGLPTNSSDALNWLKCEIENILACLEQAKKYKWHVLYFKLSNILLQYIIKSLSGWRVIEIYKEASSYQDLEEWMHAASLRNLALAYFQVGEFDEAVSRFTEVESIWHSLGHLEALTDTLTHHAFTLERLGYYKDSLAIIEEALKYEKKQKNLSGIASVLNNKGAVYWRMKKYPKARKQFNNAIKIREKIGDEYGSSKPINNLAFTYLCLGNETKAREGFLNSLQLSKKYHDYSGEAVTLNNLGYTEIFSNEPKKAIKFATDAFLSASLVGDEYQIGRSYDVKGKAYMQMGDNNNAISNFQYALSIFAVLKVPEANEVKTILDKLL